MLKKNVKSTVKKSSNLESKPKCNDCGSCNNCNQKFCGLNITMSYITSCKDRGITMQYLMDCNN